MDTEGLPSAETEKTVSASIRRRPTVMRIPLAERNSAFTWVVKRLAPSRACVLPTCLASKVQYSCDIRRWPVYPRPASSVNPLVNREDCKRMIQQGAVRRQVPEEELTIQGTHYAVTSSVRVSGAAKVIVFETLTLYDEDSHLVTNRPGSPFSSSPFGGPQRDFANDISNTFSVNHSSAGLPPSAPFRQNNGGADSIHYITKFGAQLGLDEIRLQQAHKFHTKITEKLGEIEVYVKTAWALSPAQQEALKTLVGHYLLRPAITYQKIPEAAMEYVAGHRSTYKLPHFTTDEIIKATVKLFLRSKSIEMRSAFRKALFKSVHCGLETLTDNMITDFHFNPSAVKDRPRIQAVLALQRKVALPLTTRGKNTKGADTGFWAALEKELKGLVVMNGSDRSGDKWTVWEADIIAADLALHKNTDTDVLGDAQSEDEEEEEETPAVMPEP
ncbi:hypothetical protein C8R45DRAFT_1132855 [Mycena sanguinolenta]|nr:hypothetical protein C8R45DRAFT_1132855 [Mycena sanguinolenta]